MNYVFKTIVSYDMDFDGCRKKNLVCFFVPLLGLLEAVTTSSEVTDLPWD
jgi:hypothetical protein